MRSLQGYERMFAVKIESGAVTQVKGGAVHHDGLIGKTFGSKVSTPLPTYTYTVCAYCISVGVHLQWKQLGYSVSSDP